MKQKLTKQGWDIRRIKIDGGCYEAYVVTDKGERQEAYFHPVTLAPVPTKPPTAVPTTVPTQKATPLPTAVPTTVPTPLPTVAVVPPTAVPTAQPCTLTK